MRDSSKTNAQLIEESVRLRARLEQLERSEVERKRAEETLRDSEEKYRLLIENANDAIVVTQDGMLEFFNSRAVEITGYSPEELAATPFIEFVHEDDREAVIERNKRRLEGEEFPPGYTIRAVEKSGRTMWFDVNSVPIDWEGRLATLSFLTDITDRKLAEEAVRDSEERFRQIAENVGEGFFLSDASDNSAIYISPACEKIWGMPVEAVYADPQAWLDAVHPEDRERVNAYIDEHGRGKVGFSQEYRILRPDKSVRWVHDRVYPVKNESGEIYRVVGVIEDITERKRAGEALRDSERRYRLLAENATDTIWTMDMNLEFTYVSPSITRLLGYSVEEAMALSVEEFLTPQSIRAALLVLQEELAADQLPDKELDKSRTLELEQIRKDGTTVWTELNVSFIRDEEDHPVGIQGVTRDITERKRAEEALRDGEEKYRDLFEHANDLIQSVGTDGRFLYVNRAWRETLGYDEEEIAGLSLFDIIHPDSQAHCMNVFQRVMSGEKVDGVEAVFVAKDGREVTVEGSANCRFVDGKPVATRAIFRDIAERKCAEEAIRESAARERKDREALEATLKAAWEVTAHRTEDEICKAAVEAIVKRLGFERAGIWLGSKGSRRVVGKCGSGREPGTFCGGTVSQVVEPGSLVARLLSGETERYVTEDYCAAHADRLDRERMAGVGWYAAASLKAAGGVIGYVCADNLFTNRPIDDTQLTRLALFAQNVANAIVGAREVAERRKAETLAQSSASELEVLTRLLNSARDRMESVIESVGQGIVSLDNDGRIHSVNREAARILGQEPGRLVGESLSDAGLRLEGLAELALGPGEYPRTAVKRHGGEVIEASAFRIQSAGDSPGVIVTLADITERDGMQREIAEANRRLAQLVVTDVMTGLANHRKFQEEISKQIKLAQRTSRKVSLLMIDVDRFKSYNDEFGHPAGDKVLAFVGRTLREEIRESDLAARYGGEEFAVILVETDTEGAIEVAERIRGAIEGLSGEGMPAPVTVSVGVATYPADGATPSELIEAADKALYAAKEAGRNTIRRAPEQGSDAAVRKAG